MILRHITMMISSVICDAWYVLDMVMDMVMDMDMDMVMDMDMEPYGYG